MNWFSNESRIGIRRSHSSYLLLMVHLVCGSILLLVLLGISRVGVWKIISRHPCLTGGLHHRVATLIQRPAISRVRASHLLLVARHYHRYVTCTRYLLSSVILLIIIRMHRIAGILLGGRLRPVIPISHERKT